MGLSCFSFFSRKINYENQAASYMQLKANSISSIVSYWLSLGVFGYLIIVQKTSLTKWLLLRNIPNTLNLKAGAWIAWSFLALQKTILYFMKVNIIYLLIICSWISICLLQKSQWDGGCIRCTCRKSLNNKLFQNQNICTFGQVDLQMNNAEGEKDSKIGRKSLNNKAVSESEHLCFRSSWSTNT